MINDKLTGLTRINQVLLSDGLLEAVFSSTGYMPTSYDSLMVIRGGRQPLYIATICKNGEEITGNFYADGIREGAIGSFMDALSTSSWMKKYFDSNQPYSRMGAQ